MLPTRCAKHSSIVSRAECAIFGDSSLIAAACCAAGFRSCPCPVRGPVADLTCAAPPANWLYNGRHAR